VFYSQFLSTI